MAARNQFESWMVHEDDNFIAINKPAGISSLNERNSTQVCVISEAKKYSAGLQLCHRLDKETSGLMLISKSPDTYRDISMLFEHRKINKEYHAVVSGLLQVEQKAINWPLSVTRSGMAKVDLTTGKPSETIISTLTLFKHHSLLACKPITGRLHQIRIHLATHKFPIVADTVYGGKHIYLSQLKRKFKTSKFEEEQPLMKRVALHARELRFTLHDKSYEIIAPYPKDFAVLLKMLQQYDVD